MLMHIQQEHIGLGLQNEPLYGVQLMFQTKVQVGRLQKQHPRAHVAAAPVAAQPIAAAAAAPTQAAAAEAEPQQAAEAQQGQPEPHVAGGLLSQPAAGAGAGLQAQMPRAQSREVDMDVSMEEGNGASQEPGGASSSHPAPPPPPPLSQRVGTPPAVAAATGEVPGLPEASPPPLPPSEPTQPPLPPPEIRWTNPAPGPTASAHVGQGGTADGQASDPRGEHHTMSCSNECSSGEGIGAGARGNKVRTLAHIFKRHEGCCLLRRTSDLSRNSHGSCLGQQVCTLAAMKAHVNLHSGHEACLFCVREMLSDATGWLAASLRGISALQLPLAVCMLAAMSA